MRTGPEECRLSQYSNTSFFIWGMNAVWPLDGLDRSAARTIGTVTGGIEAIFARCFGSKCGKCRM